MALGRASRSGNESLRSGTPAKPPTPLQLLSRGFRSMMPKDLKELLRAFRDQGVRYLVVGGYAFGVHAEPRATKNFVHLPSTAPSRRPDLLNALGRTRPNESGCCRCAWLCPSTSTHAKVNRCRKLCHPDRSGGTCGLRWWRNGTRRSLRHSFAVPRK
jgi:hypothetical protein